MTLAPLIKDQARHRPPDFLPEAEFVIELEQEVLAKLLMNDGAFRRVGHFLRSEHFIERVHQHIYDHIKLADRQFGTTNPLIVHKLFPADIRRVIELEMPLTLKAYLVRLAGSAVRGSPFIEETAAAVIYQRARLSLSRELLAAGTALRDPAADIVAVLADHDIARRLLDEELAALPVKPR